MKQHGTYFQYALMNTNLYPNNGQSKSQKKLLTYFKQSQAVTKYQESQQELFIKQQIQRFKDSRVQQLKIK